MTAVDTHFSIDPQGVWQLTPEAQQELRRWPVGLAELYRAQCRDMQKVFAGQMRCTDMQLDVLMRRELAIQLGWEILCLYRSARSNAAPFDDRGAVDALGAVITAATGRLLTAPTLADEQGNPSIQSALARVVERLPVCSEALSVWVGERSSVPDSPPQTLVA